MGTKKVLVVGGTGYLGQHLLQGFSEIQGITPYELAFTYNSFPPRPLLDSFPGSLAFHVDLKAGAGFHFISHQFGKRDVVVNCTALSVPRACEKDPDAATSINVPTSLEEDEALPVNVYGKSKVAAERFISEKWTNFAILSSIIFGPRTVSPVPKSLPIQWIDSVLSKGDKVEFFYDEYRSPVYVKDVVAVIRTLIEKWLSEGKKMQLLLNVGGPDRVSHVQMAEAVAQIRGHDLSLIKPIYASSVDRGVMSPADISMDITKLVQSLNISPTPFKDGVKLTLASEANL
ncbi:methionine adenosyltransferase 2 subunit beta isoform 2 [Hibiscus syriacus]|uniref:Methionine adenosyltransferase 2 subunit beta isoform 2 n=1 Tax=Hibiscus syriacus TaxID=106335 RepID=A0A6A3CW37_HIBSY|nr:methionine adenosyltransferase 2 subunit beta isoform 2 [Hibiscus syriacus]